KPTLTMEFIDNGFEFNPLLKEDPVLPDNLDEAQIGGLGIFLTKELADELEYHYENGENHLIIIKKVE
ncbi:MAG: ATP-binding protein, partial [Methanobrevibacter sp.]